MSQDDTRLHIRNLSALTEAPQAQAPPRKLFFPDTFATAQTFKAGGIGKTLNSSPGWCCKRVDFPLAILVVQLRAVNPHRALRTYKREGRSQRDHPWHVVEPPGKARSVPPTRTCTAMTTAMTTASLKHQSLRLLLEYQLVCQWTLSIVCNLGGSGKF